MPYYTGMGITNPDLHAPQHHKKEEVNYRQYEACKTCAYFNGRIGCSKVQGNVSYNGVCNLWSMIENKTMSNKEYFRTAYEDDNKTIVGEDA